ncbi:hypothetical protein Xmau_03729 [Xenorhabdus mauleonii]|uniref:Uncharacterized alpha/beta hydrolase domain n=1 Tax=Xenorhabdus mauleonii TaxID=351675 RepID=A0A1I3XY31_9GAMM|nr:DUF2235 domain-containing protein [Xenorhabdus mauleonii]PHM37767.1 hypothetical protein Xmau_03729 [Xenorhabdus mauleonii]SFK24169.1 Uncharacterized alpha/beta hydrolase domain [Xenorhabdus mauleonii]
MSQLEPADCIDCQKILKNWVEFQLVDEEGKPLSGMPYKLKSRGNKSIERTGTTDGNGLLREEDLPPMPVTLSVTAQPLADEIVKRTPRPQTGEANSPVKPTAILDGHEYQYVTLGMVSDGYPKIKGWQEEELKSSEHFKNSTLKGFSTSQLKRRHVLEMQVIESGINLTIGVFFDGTGNNTENISRRQACSPESINLTEEQVNDFICSFEAFGQAGDTSRISYDGYYTNVHFLHEIYMEEQVSENNQQIKVYIEGIGTQAGKSDSVIGYGLGVGETGVAAKTDIAIQAIKAQISSFLKETKSSVKSLQFDIIGFSRGSAAARHFANRIYHQDPVLSQALAACFTEQQRYLDNTRHPTGTTRFLGIFDTVAAIGVLSNGLNPHSADTGEIDIRLPMGIAEHIFHITAQNECRHNFSLNSVKPDYPELALPGAHSDIGGGYNQEEKENYFITRPEIATVDESIPDNATSVYKKAQKELEQLKQYPTIAPLLIGNHVRVETWQNPYFYPRNDKEMFKKQVSAAAVLSREITHDWSKVVMQVMQDAAQEAGIIFDKPKKNLEYYQLSPKLQPLADKAIAQGRAIRQGQPPVPFTEKELTLIQSKYVHCSANWNAVKLKEEKIQGGVYAVELFSFVNRPCEKWHRAVFDITRKEVS